MINIEHLNIGMDSFQGNARGANKTPEGVGNSLFQSILNQHDGNGNEQIWGASLFNDQGIPGSGSSKKNLNQKEDPIQKINNKLNQLGPLSSQIQLPEYALPKLLSFLKEHGFTDEKIQQIITASKNRDGSIQMDRLMALISNNNEMRENGNGSRLIGSDQIPKIQEFLFKAGLGAGDVKETIEKSMNRKGDLAVGRLSSELSRFFDGGLPEKEIVSLLEQYGIKLKPGSLGNQSMTPELKKELADFIQTQSMDFQNKVKQNIAALLTKKGILPQEVKSFLETLDVETSTAVLKKGSSNKTEADNLMGQISINKTANNQNGKWNEKILAVLQNEKILISDKVDKKISPDKGELKINLANLLARGDQRAQQELGVNIIGGRAQTLSEKSFASTENGGRFFLTREVPGGEFILQRPAGEARAVEGINREKGVINLPQPLPKVVDHMIWMIKAGEQRSRMMIHPPELGRLDLDLAIKNGHLHASLNAESVIVKEAIEANLNQLRQQLTDQGLIVEKFEVTVGLNDKQFRDENMWDWKKGRGSSRAKKSDKIEDDDINIINSSKTSTLNLNQIDVHV